MVSVEDPNSCQNPFPSTSTRYTPSSPSSKPIDRSMRTIRSTLFLDHLAYSLPHNSAVISDNLTDSLVDLTLGDLASANIIPPNFSLKQNDDFLQLSQDFSDFSACSSDISGELQRLACLPSSDHLLPKQDGPGVEPCLGFLQLDNFSTEIIEKISPEDLLPTVKICIEGLQSSSISVKRSAAAKLRLLAKNRSDNRALIGESGAVPALIPLLRSADPWTQEHAVTALLNLSLHESNNAPITEAGAIKSLVYVLKTGTETSKQNAACALLSLALVEENRSSIGACGAIPPLVSLLLAGSNRGKKDAMTTLYKLCSIKLNKKRAVTAGAVKPLVALVAEQGSGLAEKAMVVLSSLAGIPEGKEAIVEEGGIPVLVEAIEDGSVKGKELSVLTIVQLCVDSVQNRGLLVREGAIPPLVALSQTGSVRAKHKAETLLVYLREPRRGATPSSP